MSAKSTIMTTMNFNAKTLYVGFDAAGGGAIQGKLITDYLASKTKAQIDRNNDGYVGYVLCIGDSAHNDSIARTTGIRKALGTWKTSAAVGDVQEGTVTVSDGTLKVKELVSKQMVSTAGATWDAATAADAFGGWVSQYGTAIDVVVSNNDGMAMGCLGVASYPAGVPAFGYDANADAVQSIINGKKATTVGAYLTGTVSQNAGAQAFMTFTAVILHSGNNVITFFGGASWNFDSWPVGIRIIFALFLSIFFCTLFSALAGFFTARFKMHPFITTLSTQLIVYGLMMYATTGVNSGALDSSIKSGIAGNWGDFSKLTLYALIAIVVVWFIWNKTKFGKNMYAVGGNAEAASVSGISVFWVTLGVFIMLIKVAVHCLLLKDRVAFDLIHHRLDCAMG